MRNVFILTNTRKKKQKNVKNKKVKLIEMPYSWYEH